MGIHTIELNRIDSNNALKILQVFEILYSFIVLIVVVSANEALYICGIEFIIKIDLRIECVFERMRKQSNADVKSTFGTHLLEF